MCLPMDRHSAQLFITTVKNLTVDEIKNIGLEDRSLISRIVDFLKGEDNNTFFFYAGVSKNPIVTYKKNIEGKSVLKFSVKDFKGREKPPESGAVYSFFKGLFNFFGRVGSKELYAKVQFHGNEGFTPHYFDTAT